MANAPYDTVTLVLNSARARLQDALPSLIGTSGSILGTSQASTQQCANNGWRKCQEFLSTIGYTRLVGRTIIASLPAVTSKDPSALVSLSWSGYFDGTAQQIAPVLPQDMISPLTLKERWSGYNNGFAPMEQILDGIPSAPKQSRIRWWEWRQDAIYMPGSLMVEDLELRYMAYLSDFIDDYTTPLRWWQQPVPIMRISDSLSWFICYEFMANNSNLEFDASVFESKAQIAARLIMNRDVKAKQRVNVRRIARSAGDHCGWDYGY